MDSQGAAMSTKEIRKTSRFGSRERRGCAANEYSVGELWRKSERGQSRTEQLSVQ
jgi:hypothetical protein